MMNQEDFLKELEELLSDLAPDEREEALRYYQDLFAEAGPEGEEELLRRLGDPMKVAAEIREGLQDSSDAGEFTERGYRDERFDDDYLAPEKYAGQSRTMGNDGTYSADGGQTKARGADKKRDGILLLVLFLVFGLPILGTILSAGFSVVTGLIGCAIGILGGLISLVFGGFVAAAAFLVSGVACIFVGIINLTAPAMGLMLMCLGFLMLAVALLLFVAAGWGMKTAIPGVFRGSVHLVRGACGWCGRLLRRIFGRGGATA